MYRNLEELLFGSGGNERTRETQEERKENGEAEPISLVNREIFVLFVSEKETHRATQQPLPDRDRPGLS